MDNEIPKDKINCLICKQGFQNARELYFHLNNSHDIGITMKENFDCRICGIENKRYASYKNHLNYIHGKNKGGEKLEFESLQDFNEWKTTIEKQLLFKYAPVGDVKKTSSNEELTYYKCQYPDYSEDELASKKRLVKKIRDPSCPSMISRLFNQDTGKIKVEYYDIHVGHTITKLHTNSGAIKTSLKKQNDILPKENLNEVNKESGSRENEEMENFFQKFRRKKLLNKNIRNNSLKRSAPKLAPREKLLLSLKPRMCTTESLSVNDVSSTSTSQNDKMECISSTVTNESDVNKSLTTSSEKSCPLILPNSQKNVSSTSVLNNANLVNNVNILPNTNSGNLSNTLASPYIVLNSLPFGQNLLSGNSFSSNILNPLLPASNVSNISVPVNQTLLNSTLIGSSLLTNVNTFLPIGGTTFTIVPSNLNPDQMILQPGQTSKNPVQNFTLMPNAASLSKAETSTSTSKQLNVTCKDLLNSSSKAKTSAELSILKPLNVLANTNNVANPSTVNTLSMNVLPLNSSPVLTIPTLSGNVTITNNQAPLLLSNPTNLCLLGPLNSNIVSNETKEIDNNNSLFKQNASNEEILDNSTSMDGLYDKENKNDEDDDELHTRVKLYKLEMKYLACQEECKKLKLKLSKVTHDFKKFMNKDDKLNNQRLSDDKLDDVEESIDYFKEIEKEWEENGSLLKASSRAEDVAKKVQILLNHSEEPEVYTMIRTCDLRDLYDQLQELSELNSHLASQLRNNRQSKDNFICGTKISMPSMPLETSTSNIMANSLEQNAKLQLEISTRKIMCNICDKAFASLFNLRRHKRSIHNINELKYIRNLKCSECFACLQTESQFIQHFKDSHPGIKINIEIISFKSDEEFKEWKNAIEKSSLSSYVNIRTCKTTRSKIFYYVCNKSENYINNHILRISKIGFFCPARITKEVFMAELKKNIKVIYCSTHISH